MKLLIPPSNTMLKLLVILFVIKLYARINKFVHLLFIFKINLLPFSLAIREALSILGENILILACSFTLIYFLFLCVNSPRHRIIAQSFSCFVSKFLQNLYLSLPQSILKAIHIFRDLWCNVFPCIKTIPRAIK